jgi:leucine dehydrogenase
MSALADGVAGFEHRALHVERGERSGVFFAIAIHAPGADGVALGGCRMVAYPALSDALADALRLSRAMTLKSASVGLRHGGGKCVIAAPADGPLSAERRTEVMSDVGDLVERLGGRFLTGKDAGTTTEDFLAMAKRTSHVIGLPSEHGGSGDPSGITAFGVVTALQAACGEAFGDDSLAGRRVSVLGLGTVGGDVARRAAALGAQLVVSDIDDAKRALADELGARWVEPEQLPREPVDAFSPCALGGVLTREVVAALDCRVVAGAANNQLADDGVAEQLRERGIVWAPDFIANAGGLIGVASEVDGYDLAEAERRTAAIGTALTEVFAHAREQGTTTLAAALAYAGARSAALG